MNDSYPVYLKKKLPLPKGDVFKLGRARGEWITTAQNNIGTRVVIKGRVLDDFPCKFCVRSLATLMDKQYINNTTILGFPGYFLHIPAYLKKY